MIVVIDGYNILRSIYTQPLVTDKERHEFIRRIVRYASKKNIDVKLVFDGGLYGMPDRDQKGLVEVVFTGSRETADEWILRFIENNKGYEVAIVSSDRELVNAAQYAGMLSVRAKQFQQLLADALRTAPQVRQKSVNLRKMRKAEIDTDIDQLMHDAARMPHDKEIEDSQDDVETHYEKRSKKERKQRQKLKKL